MKKALRLNVVHESWYGDIYTFYILYFRYRTLFY